MFNAKPSSKLFYRHVMGLYIEVKKIKLNKSKIIRTHFYCTAFNNSVHNDVDAMSASVKMQTVVCKALKRLT